jgi:hypothetical protein
MTTRGREGFWGEDRCKVYLSWRGEKPFAFVSVATINRLDTNVDASSAQGRDIPLTDLRKQVEEQLDELLTAPFLFMCPLDNGHLVPISTSQEKLSKLGDILVAVNDDAEDNEKGSTHQQIILERDYTKYDTPKQAKKKNRPSCLFGRWLCCSVFVILTTIIILSLLQRRNTPTENHGVILTVYNPEGSGIGIPQLSRNNDPTWIDLLEEIVQIVSLAVSEYFVTFQVCWIYTGTWLVEMILGYFSLLRFMIDKMLAWPTVVVLVIAMNCAMFWIYKIVRLLTRFFSMRREEEEEEKEDEDIEAIKKS